MAEQPQEMQHICPYGKHVQNIISFLDVGQFWRGLSDKKYKHAGNILTDIMICAMIYDVRMIDFASNVSF